ncbi:hypothetical protein ACIGFL_24035 [Pseudomonas sp. NPDC077649]|uniref:hypothetical protein n=1 Tax=Pseudomonas sp. NPDC077649 TaxID=3364423 RepID=UPI0037C7701C
MKEIFDPEFESMRLNQLTKQCLLDMEISGEVFFGALGKENRLDFATFFFDKPDQEKIDNSGYKDSLMSLLDCLIIYRSSHEQEFSRDGIVRIKDSSASIEWIKDGEAETLADIKKSTTPQ